MLVILQSGANQEVVDHVVERIERLGLRAHISQGEFRTIIGAIGEENAAFYDQIRTIEGVENVVSIMKPYKLASRDFQPHDSQVKVGNVTIGAGAFASIAGPCAVEDKQSCMEIARAVKASGANMLRGGAFKPRTSPYSFQGLGEEGLKILRDCADEFDLPFVTEITDPRNVELVSKYADMLQVGARNMQNFVLLSEIGKIRMPVLLKRGASNTVKDWLMSAEYILSEGNSNVVLCERGSQGFENEMRFTLDVGAVALAKRDSHLPVIVDPSHAAGRRDLVMSLALAGIAVGADGLIVEVHNCPDKAKCDGPQALTPKMYEKLMQQVKALVEIIKQNQVLQETD
ncbi:MAG: 3-deoxy-7-phosphoheptulonate synthase [Sedimentisphaerales bacterium]|nr:3-deoxy-7-phosphoheptulonate synthase [Sedimentisphaerales bacterium]